MSCLVSLVSFLLLAVSSDASAQKRWDKISTSTELLSKCFLHGTKHIKLLEKDEANAHYLEIMNITSKFRGEKYHQTAGYAGPWIENHFIDGLIQLPLTYFSGMFPLFVQWSDYDVFHRNKNQHIDGKALYADLFEVLRPDVIYFTVSQANHGLPFLRDFTVVVFGGGGEGTVPIPVLNGELPLTNKSFSEKRNGSFDVGFFGVVDHGPRKSILEEFEDSLKKTQLKHFMGTDAHWREFM